MSITKIDRGKRGKGIVGKEDEGARIRKEDLSYDQKRIKKNIMTDIPSYADISQCPLAPRQNQALDYKQKLTNLNSTA